MSDSFMGGDGATAEYEVLEETTSQLEEPKTEQAVEDQNIGLHAVTTFLTEKFKEAEYARYTDEQRWLTAYMNYRGIYGPENQFTDSEKSRAFIKITKTKVNAGYAQITEVLFSANKFPIGVVPSTISKHLLEKVSVKKKQGEGETEKPKGSRIISKDILEKTGVFKGMLEGVGENAEVTEGGSTDPNAVVLEPAKQAGRAMEKTMHNQLDESEASKEVRSFVFEMALFGHGIFKGPLGTNKEYPKWDEKGKYKPILEYIPKVKSVSIWNFYPDPDAKNIGECEYTFERHKLSKSQLRSMKKEPYFRSRSIDQAIKVGASYIKKYWENTLEDNEVEGPQNRFEVFEFWGYLDREMAEEIDLKIPSEYEDMDQFQVNLWMVNDIIIRAVLNPFKPTRIPYQSCPYEINPYSFFGIGVAENMEDTQLVMNGFMRMMIDNAALSSNLIFEVDEGALVPGQDLTVYPGKVFRRQQGAPGQAIFSTKFQNVTQECIMVFDKARQLADEATGMPSYSHGGTGIQGVGRTASGMSMLMGAAAQNIKSVVRNIDDYLLVPLGKALFAFNMQFNFDKEYLGDVEIIAKGTESLMRNEIRSQKILQFLQMTANPMDAPFTKRDYLLRELAVSLDIDPEMSVNDEREAKINAMSMAEMQAPIQAVQGNGPQGQQAQGQIPGNPAGLPSPGGTEGGGVGPETPQLPQEEGFSANQGQV